MVETNWPIAKGLALDSDEVHVWRFALDLPGAVIDDLTQDLSDEERGRATRFTFDRDRRRYVAAHGALRRILGQYLFESPAAVLLTAEAGGKPRLVAHSHVRFNLAHSANLGLVAIAPAREVGVDVERSRDPFDGVESLAATCMSDEELMALRRLPERDRRAAFFSTWTRKEAFLKGLGQGLLRELDSFDVTVPPAEARLLRVQDDPTQPDRWTLRELVPERGFAATVAFEGRATVRCWTWMHEEGGIHGSRHAGDDGAVRGSDQPRGAIFGLGCRPVVARGLAVDGDDGLAGGVPRPHRGSVDGHEAGQPPFGAGARPVGPRAPEGDLG